MLTRQKNLTNVVYFSHTHSLRMLDVCLRTTIIYPVATVTDGCHDFPTLSHTYRNILIVFHQVRELSMNV